MSASKKFYHPDFGHVEASDDYERLGEELNSSRVALVMMAGRIGVRSLITFLEYKFFTPGTPMNRHFRFCIVRWEGMKWLVVIIHKKHLPDADTLCKLFGLRRADGIPHVVQFAGYEGIHGVGAVRDHRTAARFMGQDVERVVKFPLDGPNVWTIENIANHFTYDNDPELEAKARAFEDQACESLIAEHTERLAAGEFDHEPGTPPVNRL